MEVGRDEGIRERISGLMVVWQERKSEGVDWCLSQYDLSLNMERLGEGIHTEYNRRKVLSFLSIFSPRLYTFLSLFPKKFYLLIVVPMKSWCLTSDLVGFSLLCLVLCNCTRTDRTVGLSMRVFDTNSLGLFLGKWNKWF